MGLAMKKIVLLSATLGFLSVWTGFFLFNNLVNHTSTDERVTISNNYPTTPEPTFSRHVETNYNTDSTFFTTTTATTSSSERVVDEYPEDSFIPETTVQISTANTGETVAGVKTERKIVRSSNQSNKKKPAPTTPPKPPVQIATSTPTPLPPVSSPKPIPTSTTPIIPPNITTPTSTMTAKPIKWGVFAGSNPTVIADFENRVSENPDYLAFFVHWGNGGGALPSFLSDYAYKKDRTLVLFWEASDYKLGGTVQPDYSYQSILSGKWDTYFKDFAKQLTVYKGPIILVPFSELNGNWNPWSGTTNGNKPQDAVVAWRYIHKFFDAVPNVKFGLAVNAASVPNTPENQIANYYPGDAYVDYVGVDGFNMGNPSLSFDALFNKPLNILKQYNKPVMIFSFGTGASPDKAAWLNDALNVQLQKYPFVTGWIYFNQNKERNWLLWSDPNTFSVFTKYITQ